MGDTGNLASPEAVSQGLRPVSDDVSSALWVKARMSWLQAKDWR